MTTEHDVIVIGAGLAGLAAGATARRAGASTLVLDAHQMGGRARVTERDGFVFNMGGHALYRGSHGWEVLKTLGAEVAGSAPPLDRYQGLAGDQLHLLPTSAGSMLRTTALGWRGKLQVGMLLTKLGRMQPSEHRGVTADQWIRDQDLRPDAEMVVRALVRIGTYTGDASAISADAVIAQLQAALATGVLYLHGGWAQLYEGLGSQVEVRTATKVKSVSSSTGGRVEVLTDAGPLVAKSVVVAAGAPEAVRSVLPVDPGWGELGPEVTAACLDAGLRRIPDPGYVLGLDRPLYTTVQSPPGRQCPEGQAVVATIRYGARSAQLDRPDLEAHMMRAGIRPDDIVTSRFLARMVVSGAAPRADRGGLPGRPGTGDSGQPGVFLAGDWVGEHGLLADAALSSGHAAGRAAAAFASASPRLAVA